MSIDMSQFFQVFFEESAEHLAEMERLLLEMDVNAPDREEMNAIFRAAHSIKGGSGTFGFTDMADVTHILENLLDRLRKGELLPHAEMIDVFLEATDVLKEQLNCHIRGTKANTQPAEAVCAKLYAMTQDKAPQATVHAQTKPAFVNNAPPQTSATSVTPTSAPTLNIFEIDFRPGATFLKRESGIKDLTAELSRIGALQTLSAPADENSPMGSDQKNLSHAPGWRFQLTTAETMESLQDLFSFIANPGDVSIVKTEYEYIDAAPESGDNTIFECSLTLSNAYKELPKVFPSIPSRDDEDGYGFFTPLLTHALDDDLGYGFFSEMPLIPNEAQAEPYEDGVGYGFFSPRDEPASETAPQPSLPPKIDTKQEDPTRTKEKPNAALGETSIRVGVERVDQLINLVGELVITQAMLTQTAANIDPILHEALHNGLAQLERNTRDLQEAVMSIRMLPISFVFSRFPRLVRDLALKLNKQVDLVTIGENTELDKGLIEKIADPLTHLVRNSLDHGIETPDIRIAANKPAKGTITLSAAHQGGNIVIAVSDNGAGLNRDKILAKATERGLNVTAAMSDDEVWMLIFEPGFSTAEVVTDVSGRGVGMDVVKRNITQMGGAVSISSTPGIGTTMTIRLPLTLAILDGMSVSLGDSIYVIPLNMIVETMQPQADEIKTVTGRGHMVQVRGEYLPIIALHRVFNLPTHITDPCNGVLVLIETEGKKAALFVDALMGQQQVVIKSLETNFRKIAGVSGATIMGDGTVALILDVASLIKLGNNEGMRK